MEVPLIGAWMDFFRVNLLAAHVAILQIIQNMPIDSLPSTFNRGNFTIASVDENVFSRSKLNDNQGVLRCDFPVFVAQYQISTVRVSNLIYEQLCHVRECSVYVNTSNCCKILLFPIFFSPVKKMNRDQYSNSVFKFLRGTLRLSNMLPVMLLINLSIAIVQ